MAKFKFNEFNNREMEKVGKEIRKISLTAPIDASTSDSAYTNDPWNDPNATFTVVEASGNNVTHLVGFALDDNGDTQTYGINSNKLANLLPNPLNISNLNVTGTISAATVSAGLVNAATVSADLVSAANGNFTNLTVSGNTTLGDNIGDDTITLNGRTIGSNASFNNLTVTGNTTLGDSSSDTIILNGTVQGTHFGDIRANSVMANTLTFNGTLYEPDPFSSISEVWVPYQPYIIGTNSSVHPIIDGDSVDLTANKLWIEVSGSNIFLNVYIPHGSAGDINGYYRCQLTERPST